MNNKNLFLFLLALLLLASVSAMPVTSRALAAPAMGDEVRGTTTTVAPGVTVTEQALWSVDKFDLRAEHYLTYIPGGKVLPVVAYSPYVSGLQTLTDMARTLEERGMRVAGGTNGGFYVVKNGVPLGLVVSDGLLQSSADDNFCAIGFMADGSAIMGRPVIRISASWTQMPRPSEEQPDTDAEQPDEERHDGEQSDAEEDLSFWPLVLEEPPQPQPRNISISGLNKIREDGGYYLFTDAFAPTTKSNVDGIDVVLLPVNGEAGLPVHGSVACQVESVRPSTPDNTIPAGRFVLSMNQNSPDEHLALLSALQPGDTLTLTVSAEGEWEDVVQAVSGLNVLIRGGELTNEAPADGSAPRTAVGIRGDGSVIFYTIDGRKAGYSIGASYDLVARRMLELGCVEAMTLDGGGSTTCGATYPDQEKFEVINRGSDGVPRSVSTCLLLAQKAETTGELGGFFLRAENDLVLPGCSVPITVTATDTLFRAMDWREELTWQTQLGLVSPDGAGGWVYTAPSVSEGNPTDTISVFSCEKTGSLSLRVINQANTVAITQQGKRISSLTVKAGETVGLDARCWFYNLPVAGQDSLYTWEVDPAVGSVDGEGNFTAASEDALGTLTLTGAGHTVSLPVTVVDVGPFVDIENSWAREHIVRLYHLGIVNGAPDANGDWRFSPDRGISRGELLTMTARLLGVVPAVYEDVELPFADAVEIADWLLPYAKAAWSLNLLTGAARDGGLYADLGRNVTREEAMTILSRALGQTVSADLSLFADAGDVDAWARPAVETLVALGIVQGSGGLLRPLDGITRGETAKLIRVCRDLRGGA